MDDNTQTLAESWDGIYSMLNELIAGYLINASTHNIPAHVSEEIAISIGKEMLANWMTLAQIGQIVKVNEDMQLNNLFKSKSQ